MEALVTLTRELQDKGHLTKPAVWLHAGLSEEVANKVKNAVKQLNGTLVESDSGEKVTHKVYPNPPSGGPDLSKHLARVVEAR